MTVYNRRLKRAWYRMRHATSRATGVAYAHEYLNAHTSSHKTYGIITDFTITEARNPETGEIEQVFLYSFVSPTGETRIEMTEYTAAQEDFLEAIPHREQRRIGGNYVTLVVVEQRDDGRYYPRWEGNCRCPISTEAAVPDSYGTSAAEPVDAHGESSDTGDESARDREAGRGAA